MHQEDYIAKPPSGRFGVFFGIGPGGNRCRATRSAAGGPPYLARIAGQEVVGQHLS